jgi:hypothetical protein
MEEETRLLTVSQAYEAAYRFVAQYSSREQESVSLSLMVVAMEPVTEHFLLHDPPYVTHDPASWFDWEQCVDETLTGAPLPSPYEPEK